MSAAFEAFDTGTYWDFRQAELSPEQQERFMDHVRHAVMDSVTLERVIAIHGRKVELIFSSGVSRQIDWPKDCG